MLQYIMYVYYYGGGIYMRKYWVYALVVCTVVCIMSGCKRNGGTELSSREKEIAREWSETLNTKGRNGTDIQLNNDGTYYFGEINPYNEGDGLDVEMLSYGTWSASDTEITFKSVNDFFEDNEGIMQYTLEDDCMTLTYHGENNDYEYVLYANDEVKEPDDMEKSGLLFSWESDENNNISVEFSYDYDGNYHISYSLGEAGYNNCGAHISKVTDEYLELDELYDDDDTKESEDSSRMYYDLSSDGKECVFTIDDVSVVLTLNKNIY